MDELGEIAKSHQAIFVNGYVLCDWVKERLNGLDISDEEREDFIEGMIEFVEDDGDYDD